MNNGHGQRDGLYLLSCPDRGFPHLSRWPRRAALELEAASGLTFFQHGDTLMFKNDLDPFLASVPDQDLARAAQTNSLLHQVPMMGGWQFQ